MQVKLSYTIDIEDVLGEMTNLLGGASPSMQEAIDLYNAAVNGFNEEEFNPNIFFERVEKLRKSLERVQVRVNEVVQIVEGYGEYKKQQRSSATNINSEQPDATPSEASLREKFVGTSATAAAQEVVND